MAGVAKSSAVGWGTVIMTGRLPWGLYTIEPPSIHKSSVFVIIGVGRVVVVDLGHIGNFTQHVIGTAGVGIVKLDKLIGESRRQDHQLSFIPGLGEEKSDERVPVGGLERVDDPEVSKPVELAVIGGVEVVVCRGDALGDVRYPVVVSAGWLLPVEEIAEGPGFHHQGLVPCSAATGQL
jgi:hypothetical protein